MIADALRIEDIDEKDLIEEVDHRELRTKEDIKNYVKGLM